MQVNSLLKNPSRKMTKLFKFIALLLSLLFSGFVGKKMGENKIKDQQTTEAIHDIEKIRKVEVETDSMSRAAKRKFLQDHCADDNN